MRVVTNLDHFKNERPIVLALGNFDGVHLGHQEIFRAAANHAKKTNGETAVLTFGEHPQQVLHSNKKPMFLTSLSQRLALLEKVGINICFLMKFTDEFSKMSAESFVENIIVNKIHADAVCMGSNARFGHGRSGDARLMRKLALSNELSLYEISSVQIDGVSVSSTVIREAIQKGDLDQASRWLGRPYSFYGTVVSGAGRGTQLGFATANLDVQNEIVPPTGVYVVKVDRIQDEYLGKTETGYTHQKKVVQSGLPGVLNYGVRPTFESESVPLCEVHLLDFDSELKGQTLEVTFVKKIREEKKFDRAEELTHQIKNDVLAARQVLGLGPNPQKKYAQSQFILV